MAIETKTIQIRQGNKADLLTTELLPGEQMLALDTGEVGIKSAGGDIVWYATTAGINKAVPYTEKGEAGGVPQFPAALPAIGSLLKLDANGVLAPAVDGVDYGIRKTVLWEGSLTTNDTEITLVDDIRNYKMLEIIGTANVYNNNAMGCIMPLANNGAGRGWYNGTAYYNKLIIDVGVAVTFTLNGNKLKSYSSGNFSTANHLTAIYGYR